MTAYHCSLPSSIPSPPSTLNSRGVCVSFTLAEREANLRYPKGDILDKSVPSSVSANYREAKRVQKVSPNGFAVLIRRTLEALCNDRDVPAGRLQKRLETLAQLGEIPPVLAEITSVLRTLGNSGGSSTCTWHPLALKNSDGTFIVKGVDEYQKDGEDTETKPRTISVRWL